MESPLTKKDIKLNLRIYHEAKLAEVTRFQNFHISLLEIFPTNLKFGFQKMKDYNGILLQKNF